MSASAMNPFDRAQAVQVALDATLYEPIPVPDVVVEYEPVFGASLWRWETGHPLPIDFVDTQPMEPRL